MWMKSRKGSSGFSASSTAEEVTHGIDATGLTAIVTGASSGIGTETARVLALHGAHVVMGVRNVAAGKEVKEAIVKEIPTAKIDVMGLDLCSLASVKKFAMDFNSSGFPLNILMPFLLTNLLLETMKKTAHESTKEGRIVNISSRQHQFSYKEGICFEKINDPSRYKSLSAYGQSKLANVLHANELARHLKEDGANITANSLHPGAISTNLFRHYGFASGIINMVGKYILKNVQQGAATSCYVALHPQVKGISSQSKSTS